MVRITRILGGWLVPVAAAAVLSSGCATKGFVRDYVETQVAPQRDATNRLQTDLMAVKTTADSANAHALDAQTLARSAMDEAAAARRLSSKIASGDLHYNVVQSREVNFGFDKYTLTPKTRGALDEVAQVLDQNPRYILEIVGNTDQVGNPRYNLRLGQERAETVRRYLNDEHHVPLSKMATISYGSGKPVSHGEGDANRSRNRRAEIRILEVQDVDLADLTTTPR
jgi:outer membrane protein OmpA-like peptidoglycan-associated protein